MFFHTKTSKNSTRQPLILISLLLILVTIAVYWQVRGFDFVSFDDNVYITENKNINEGFSLDNIVWAFNPSKTDDYAYWHPLTWLSHMLDCQLFGLNAGPHHLVNLMFHLINVLLLFLAFYLMTGAIWQSGFVAALFALHPINVDSVAWIAERKNLLSTTFWMLTLLAYIYYARKPNFLRYLLIFCILTLGLLAKPMLVTLPFVLLLLDYWPLGRVDLGQNSLITHSGSVRLFQAADPVRLVIEKIPLLILSFIAIVFSAFSLQIKHRLVDHARVPMSMRIENAIVSYVDYLWKLIWPTHLSFYYPFPKLIPLWEPFCAAFFLLFITVIIIICAKKKFPWLVTGWLWYIGTLLPVIGLVQGGLWPALADRWAYVPFIGIFIMVAWGIPELTKFLPRQKTWLMVIGSLVLCLLSALTWNQAGYWRDSMALFSHAINVTKNNPVAHYNLGLVFEKNGETDQAIVHYQKSISFDPIEPSYHMKLGETLMGKGDMARALIYFQNAVKLTPEDKEAQYNLGTFFFKQGRYDEAIPYLEKAVRLDPDNDQAQFNLANSLFQKKRHEDALIHAQKAIALNPEHEKAHQLAGTILLEQGQFAQALIQFDAVLTINPKSTAAHHFKGLIFLQQKQMGKALASFKKALMYDPERKDTRKLVEQLTAKLTNLEKQLVRELGKDPDNPGLRKQLGKTYQMLDLNDKALEQFERVIRQNPKSIDALYDLAALHADQGQYTTAITCIEQALSYQPDNPTHDYNMACLYARQNKTAEALSWLKKALDKGYRNWEQIRTDEDLKSIKNTREFEQIMENR